MNKFSGNRTAVSAALIALLCGTVISATALGSVYVPLKKTVMIILSQMPFFTFDPVWSKAQELIILQVRLPRVLIASAVGGALALSGAVMQGLFKNPMADPGIIGVTSGGALGAVIAIYFGWAAGYFYALPASAFAGSLICAFLVYAIAAEHGHAPVHLLLLSGIAVGGVVISATSFVLSLALKNYDLGRQIIFWLMGGLDGRSWTHLKMSLPVIVPASVAILAYARDLNIMLFGEENAQGLGVNVVWTRRTLLLLTALVTGVSVSVSGSIAFVGLVIPHVMRLIVGPDHRSLLPASFLAGASFLPVADLVCRIIIRPEELRLGVVTSCIGGPFFIYLLIKRKRAAGLQ